jgi:spore germination protein KB
LRQEKITGWQLWLLLIPSILSTEILSVPAIMAKFAGRDAWLAVIPASVTGFWSIFVLTALARRYPGLTIIEYSSKIIGKWPTKLLEFYFAYIFFIYVTVQNYEHFGFISDIELQNTPTLIINGIFLLVCGWMVYEGIEAIGRCSEVIVPSILFFTFLFSLISFPDADMSRLQPMLEHGISPVLKAAIVPSGWMGEFLFIGFLLPHLDHPEKGRILSVLAICTVIVITMLVTTFAVAVLGDLTAQLAYPVFAITQYVSIADFIHNMDAFIVGLWTAGIFVKMSVSLFLFCVCVTNFFGSANYRVFIIPLILLSMIGTQIVRDTTHLHEFLIYTSPFASFVTCNLLPTVLYIVDSIKRRVEKNELSLYRIKPPQSN